MVFLDNASTTKVNSEVQEVINKFNTEYFYNPSAIYINSFNVAKQISKARANLIERLNGNKDDDSVIYTSCATESNNMVLRACIKKNGKALVSISEHPSVYKVAKDLINSGYNIEFVNVNKDGRIDFDDFNKKMTSDVNFVSIMHVNNETGAINDIEQLVRYAKSVNKNVLFHSDGVQAFGKIDVNVSKMGVDFYTISAHKIYGPKGIGALYVKNSKYIKPLLLGGGQENELRSGTENVSGIMALDKASEILIPNLDSNYKHVIELNNYVRSNVNNAIVISSNYSSPYILMLGFEGVRAETILHMMAEHGYLIGNGSACSSKKKENRNLSAMGYPNKVIEGSIRISFSINNNLEEIIEFTECLNKVIKEYKSKVS